MGRGVLMESQLRIALFGGNYNFQADGANKALNRLVGYLERENIEVLVFSPTNEKHAFDAPGTVVSIPSMPIPFRSEYRIGTGLSRRVKQKLLDFKPTLIHLSAPDIIGHSALKFAERENIPAVASFHTRFDTYFEYYNVGWLAPWCRRQMAKYYKRCQHVYVPSPSVGDVLQSQEIVGENIRTWSRGIDRNFFNPDKRDMAWRRNLGIDDADIVLTFVGRLVKEKGLNEYADLVDSLRQRGLPVKAMIVGDGPERGRIEGTLPGAILTGHLTGPDLSRAYASSDIFINPSLTETFGNVTLEAMASGVPSVCLRATGTSDLIQNGENGWLIDSPDDPDWTEKTAELCTDKQLRRQMGRRAREISADYNWDRIMQNLVGNYRQVLTRYRQTV
ncbi:MAG: glycosyltransferase family 1 protein [Hellea sp.]|nr:glycosyltransferase family 1 protein [Hellea sp.]